ncbi:hypothetical protein E4U12_002054 [Claviceps purpurea]|nr:hypothetical protein E4U12_002054 [Claviceps purpurea]
MIQVPSLPSPPYCAPHVHALPVFRRNVRHIGFRDSLDQQVWYQSLEEAKPRHRPTGGREDVCDLVYQTKQVILSSTLDTAYPLPHSLRSSPALE